jgi:hypothetical protein
MRPPHVVIIEALNLAHDYIYYLTLRIHSNNCAILAPSHEKQRYFTSDYVGITKNPGRLSEHSQQCDQTDLETLPLGQTAGPRHRFRLGWMAR